MKLLLLRQLPGPDRPDYWLAELETPLHLMIDETQRTVRFAIVSSRWVDRPIGPRVEQVPVNLALVFDESQLQEETVDFSKSKFSAIGTADEVSESILPKESNKIIMGIVHRVFGNKLPENSKSDKTR